MLSSWVSNESLHFKNQYKTKIDIYFHYRVIALFVGIHNMWGQCSLLISSATNTCKICKNHAIDDTNMKSDAQLGCDLGRDIGTFQIFPVRKTCSCSVFLM